MAYYNNYNSSSSSLMQHPTPSAAASHHHTRSKRQPRLQNQAPSSSRQFRSTITTPAPRSDSASSSSITAFRSRFELMRSFDIEDDLEFCPALLTEDDYSSIGSSSDRSSLSSNSPSSSPVQALAQPQQQTPPFAIHATFQPSSSHLSSSAQPFVAAQSQASSAKNTLTLAARPRHAIPIVNPSTGMRVANEARDRSPSGFRRW